MSTTNTTLTKWDLPIPVRLSSGGKHDLERWAVNHFETRVSPGLFTELDLPGPYVQLAVGESQCTVGREVTSGAQTVNYKIGKKSDDEIKHTLLHEMGHCLGVAHEHYHSQFPWDIPTTPNQYVNVQQKHCTTRSWVLYSNSTIHFQQHLTRTSMNRRSNQCKDLTTFCDLSSIMMYGALLKILLANPQHFPMTVNLRYSPSQHQELSASDVEGIRSLYGLDLIGAEIKVRTERSRLAVAESMSRAATAVSGAVNSV